MVLGVRWDVDIIKLTASAQYIYREVNVQLGTFYVDAFYS